MSEPLADSPSSPAPLGVKDAWALAVKAGRGVLVSREGEIEDASPKSLAARIGAGGVLLVHAPFTWRRLGARPPARTAGLYDLAELFAFARPAQFATPTPRGLAATLNAEAGASIEDEAALLHKAADRLLAEVAALQGEDRDGAAAAAVHMARAGWPWAAEVIAALRIVPTARARSFEPWRALKEWEEIPPRPEPGLTPLAPGEARAALEQLIARALRADSREERSAQADYAESAAQIFAPRAREDEPNIVLAEAGTGIGKTLGYLAPSALWARRNDGAVWISTYTKNLQRQIAQTLKSIEPRTGAAPLRSLVRKGRENYACLLNIQEAAMGLFDGVAIGLVGRWLQHTEDGDMVGGDFPAWLAPLLARGVTERGAGIEALGLTDRRGECIFGACAHYRRCFIERVRRETEEAEIVVANHALLITRAADDAAMPDNLRRRNLTRLVLDEGHHLFDAADGAFCAHLTATEMAEMRRWIRGHEDRARARRGRTLIDRLSDLMPDDADAEELLQGALRAAHVLPSELWRRRLGEDGGGPGYRFLSAVEHQVLARSTESKDNEFGLECPVHPAQEPVKEAGAALNEALGVLEIRLRALARRLAQRLTDDAEKLDSAMRGRLESVVRTLAVRTETILPAWRAMLASLESETPKSFVDWLSLTRGARESDVGMHRHYLDPTQPLAETLYKPAHGVLVTSATLFDTAGDARISPPVYGGSAPDWIGGEGGQCERQSKAPSVVPDRVGDDTSPVNGGGESEHFSAPGRKANVQRSGERAHDRTGASHLARPPAAYRFASPFPYAERTRFIVVRDVETGNIEQLAAAMRVMFEASGGGALGLFTSIARLCAVHKRIALPLEQRGLPVYAQHVDEMDTGTLVDIFRFETDSCLLGTDAVRDGIDVPGRSLRLIVLERVPWARPDLMHKARRDTFGGRTFEEEIVRRRIAQAFGRLMRREGDKGVFVLLGAQTPTRLLTSLPPDVEITRTGLADAAERIHGFVG